MKASVEHVREKFAFTERRACRLLLVPVSSNVSWIRKFGQGDKWKGCS